MRVHANLLVVVFSFLFVLTSFAETNKEVRKKEVIEFVKKAVAYEKKVGKDKAFEEFNKPNGQFNTGYLYIYSFYYRGPKKNVCLAHGLYPDWAGKDKTDYIDSISGARIIPIFSYTAAKGGGWVTYHFEDPVSHKIRVKHGYIYPVPGKDFFIASGYYGGDFEPG